MCIKFPHSFSQFLFTYLHFRVSSVHVVAPVVKIISYCLTLGLNFYQLRQGVVTSGVLFFFWFLQALCGAFTFRSVLSTDYVVGDDRILPFTTYVIQYPIIVAMFFMNCFADAKPKAINLEGTFRWSTFLIHYLYKL